MPLCVREHGKVQRIAMFGYEQTKYVMFYLLTVNKRMTFSKCNYYVLDLMASTCEHLCMYISPLKSINSVRKERISFFFTASSRDRRAKNMKGPHFSSHHTHNALRCLFIHEIWLVRWLIYRRHETNFYFIRRKNALFSSLFIINDDERFFSSAKFLVFLNI